LLVLCLKTMSPRDFHYVLRDMKLNCCVRRRSTRRET
jgi:hypothetical protein